MQNQKTKKIQRLRGVALDENEAPKERIIAASKLLTDFGPTERNIVVINKVVKLYGSDPDYAVQQRCLKLKDKLVKARGLMEVVKEELPEESEPTVTEEEPPTIVAGTSASDIPNGSLPLTRDGIEQVIRRVTGVPIYETLPDLGTLSITNQNLIIEKIVYGCGFELAPTEIQRVIDNLISPRLGEQFTGLIEVARRYLAVTIDLLEKLNRRDFAGVLS